MIHGAAGLLGLFCGLLCGGLGLYAGMRAAKKRRGLDERYEEIKKLATKASWAITMIGLVVVYVLVTVEVIKSPLAVVNTLYMIHMFGWALSLFYYGKKL